MREQKYRSRRISVSVRDTKLNWASCQRTLGHGTNLEDEIAETAMSLFSERYLKLLPLRSIGISCGQLESDSSPVQLDMFGDVIKRDAKLALSKTIDDLRMQYGQLSVQRGVIMADTVFSKLNPRDDHMNPVRGGQKNRMDAGILCTFSLN
jgi:hypothetical protein